MGSNPGRPRANWKGSQHGWFFLCIIQHYYDQRKLRGDKLAGAFLKHVSEPLLRSVISAPDLKEHPDWNLRNAIAQRGDKGDRYPNEHPSNNTNCKLLILRARDAIRDGAKFTRYPTLDQYINIKSEKKIQLKKNTSLEIKCPVCSTKFYHEEK